MRPVQIGLSDEQRTGSISALNAALCNEMLLSIKTKKAHWDVVGPQFLTVPRLLQEQYDKMSDFSDGVAERARMLGGYPVGSAAGFIEGATLREEPGKLRNVTEILAGLLVDHEIVARDLRESAHRVDTVHGDRGTSDYLIAILQAHEEMAWMLRSFLEGEAVAADGRISLPNQATPSLA